MTAPKSRDAHYAMLNDRFEGRALRLRKLGFKYTHIPEWDTAVFAKPRLGKNVPTTVPATFVMHADEVVWNDRLEEERI